MNGSKKDLVPGALVRVAGGVQRLVAPNASLMTGPGTNSYVIGDPAVAVLDPGPDDPGHLALLLKAVPRPRFIFVTHTHRDHSCGARALAAATGAPIVGLPPPADGRQDETCVPDIHPANDQVFTLAGDSGGDTAGSTGAVQSAASTRLRAIHTPGHASNHVCFLLEEAGLLFSGDHVLEGVTPVILPPDGDMGAYLDALRRLKTYALRAILPGHGGVMTEPVASIDFVIAHRGRREAKVLEVLEAVRAGSLDELLPKVYDDVRAELLPIARLSLEAHLIKLLREGRALRDGESWLACRG
ncbi:MAG TPA: MBL fold metallo-hydrolase [Steroidobacteraceae bacterium]|jgi:glyoxylase-like metal-dependent hydrolase (beta-lactamase superfamily II)|nr:MBL fold metallo-hydrolase [Steroidobacteraceae bacterium]